MTRHGYCITEDELQAERLNAAFKLGMARAIEGKDCNPWNDFGWGMLACDGTGYSRALERAFIDGWGESMKNMGHS